MDCFMRTHIRASIASTTGFTKNKYAYASIHLAAFLGYSLEYWHFANARELPAWPNGYSARQLKLLANPLALGRVRIQEASKNRQQFFL